MGIFGRLILVMAVAFFATACAFEFFDEIEDFEYTPSSEIPPGEGLVTGKSGEWVIYKQ